MKVLISRQGAIDKEALVLERTHGDEEAELDARVETPAAAEIRIRRRNHRRVQPGIGARHVPPPLAFELNTQ